MISKDSFIITLYNQTDWQLFEYLTPILGSMGRIAAKGFYGILHGDYDQAGIAGGELGQVKK